MLIMGMPFWTFFWLFIIRALGLLLGIYMTVVGIYEGKRIEEKYDVQNWYHTW
jgi:hypothetical protein